jgi:hypothetical protein
MVLMVICYSKRPCLGVVKLGEDEDEDAEKSTAR